ncbi:DUF2924 domain-containing protein [Mesorhizobium sp. AR10]|uniref:DUF2924 domain-containing protein n=1 Tax=Mesorhizobium sp. AR10 TaxID=2865839 RepID=UPI002160C7A5|nr:DUF2924 domain-containing protein [Mesorhizobium sp. AR10]UVK40723.1 DUF2924 domain-containing protein [Mesorhizobium sp. AR10]
MRKRQDLDSEITGVGDLTRDDLTAAWTKTYGCPPPKGVKRGLLERPAAWHLQAKRLGGLTSTVEKTLGTFVPDRPTRKPAFENLEKSANTPRRPQF